MYSKISLQLIYPVLVIKAFAAEKNKYGGRHINKLIWLQLLIARKGLNRQLYMRGCWRPIIKYNKKARQYRAGYT
jgi:hypothetical protein